MLQQRICPRWCGRMLDVSPADGRLYAPDEPGPHWHAPIEEPIADIIECVCGAVVWRAADGAKTDAATGEPHTHHVAAASPGRLVVAEEQARGGATPPPRPVAPVKPVPPNGAPLPTLPLRGFRDLDV